MSLLCLVSSNTFQLASVKSRHLITWSVPVHIFHSPSLFIISGHRPSVIFKQRRLFLSQGRPWCCPSTWNTLSSGVLQQWLLLLSTVHFLLQARNLKCSLSQSCCSLSHFPILFPPQQHLLLLKIDFFKIGLPVLLSPHFGMCHHTTTDRWTG